MRAGLKEYTIVRNKMGQQGRIELAAKETNVVDADLVVGTLEGARGKRNPLQSVRNVQLKVEDGRIVAINLDGDCVVRK